GQKWIGSLAEIKRALVRGPESALFCRIHAHIHTHLHAFRRHHEHYARQFRREPIFIPEFPSPSWFVHASSSSARSIQVAVQLFVGRQGPAVVRSINACRSTCSVQESQSSTFTSPGDVPSAPGGLQGAVQYRGVSERSIPEVRGHTRQDDRLTSRHDESLSADRSSGHEDLGHS
ncbi:hypothetical protein B0O80DRAFT_523535, partial [Mortierella sp. GBAus27b]